MNSENNEGLAKLFGINDESPLLSLVEESIPFIGKALSVYKMNRFNKRLKRIENRLLNLTYSLRENEDALLNSVFQKIVLPVTLNDVLEEHEEEKIDLILNGIEYIYKNKIDNTSEILIYFDVLRELRVNELKELYKYTLPEEKPKKREKFKYKKITIDEDNELKKNGAFRSYIENHLEKLDLVDSTAILKISILEDLTQEDTRDNFFKTRAKKGLTPFGKHFIEFINLDVKIYYQMDEVLDKG
ncbi:hypothetical protein [Paenibacillus piscarius]|uniref:hypothetical protein n=1 Tax=Paenibacillus piscarius TaxID=1089681 RepID=UPI001EE80605|nr:hypothetical protein [Paenibacillus piscarius]